MPPYQQQTPQSNYDFFMNPPKPPKRPMFSMGGTLASRAVIIIGAGVLLMVVIGVVSSVFFGGPSNTDQLLKVAQEQNEIARIATLAQYQGKSTDTKNFAITTQLSMQSAQTQLLKVLAQRGVKFNAKQLQLTKNPQTDSSLQTAAAASVFDQTFSSVMQSQIQDYSNLVKDTFETSKSKSIRGQLVVDYNSAQLLLSELTPTTVTPTPAQ
jgi:predicted outer membrane protein